MKKYIKINLHRTNKNDVKSFCDEFGLDIEVVLTDKKRGHATLWYVITDDTVWVVAYTRSSNENKVLFIYDSFKGKLGEFVDFNKRKKVIVSNSPTNKSKKIEINLNVDSILDKINSKGLSSLSKEELNFLES